MNDKKLAQVFHYDLYGKREEKYEFLNSFILKNILWTDVEPKFASYSFSNLNNEELDRYNSGINIEALFLLNATGVKTERDVLTIQFISKEIEEILADIRSQSIEALRLKYKLEKDGRDWQLSNAKTDILTNPYSIVHIHYRPFDFRFTAYTGITKGFMAYPREKIMTHFLEDNLALISTRINRGLSQGYNFVSRKIIDLHLLDSAADSLQTFPLYLYQNTDELGNERKKYRTPNLNPQIVQQLVGQLSLTFTPEKESTPNTLSPIDILDYIYAILHSPTYRAKYKEFLKIDFPRIPYPKDQETFWKFVELGGELRQIHLLESPVVEKFITSYPVSGTNEVGKVRYEDKKVWINESQYFDHLPQIAWEFYIGGYQPAQKWLKDRKGRQLSFEDVRHYQKIIVALTETDRIMGEIDEIEFE